MIRYFLISNINIWSGHPQSLLCELELLFYDILCVTCQRRSNKQRDALHDGEQPQRRREAPHLHYIHQDGEHQRPDHAHRKSVRDHIRHQHGESGPDAADAVTEPVEEQGGGKHINMAPFEPGHVEHDGERRPHHDVNDTQDGEQQRSPARLHAVGRGVRNQIYQRHHEAQHHKSDAYGKHTVMPVVEELIEGHVFFDGGHQRPPSGPEPQFPLRLLFWRRRCAVHQRLAAMLFGLKGPHHSAAHAAVQQDGAQDEKAPPPAELWVEVVSQERQSAESQGRSCGGHGVGKRTPTHKVVTQDGDGRLETEAEAESWNRVEMLVLMSGK